MTVQIFLLSNNQTNVLKTIILKIQVENTQKVSRRKRKIDNGNGYLSDYADMNRWGRKTPLPPLFCVQGRRPLGGLTQEEVPLSSPARHTGYEQLIERKENGLNTQTLSSWGLWQIFAWRPFSLYITHYRLFWQDFFTCMQPDISPAQRKQVRGFCRDVETLFQRPGMALLIGSVWRRRMCMIGVITRKREKSLVAAFI